MKGIKPWLVLLLVFVAGIAVGVLGTRSVLRRGADRAIRDPKFARERVDSMRDRMEKELVSNLELTPEQEAKIHQIFTQSGEQMRALHTDFEPRMKEIFQTAHTNIAANLTTEQREKFEKLTKERRERFEKFRDKGFGSPHHGDRMPPPEKR